MAKAAGNGHPLGWVVTSEEIAADFAIDGSFFSSSGGGPVSCEIGLAVLETIEREHLQENARIVGEYLNEKLITLQVKHNDIIGAIHGHGLYQGIELIRPVSKDMLEDDVGTSPATSEAFAICERLLELGEITF
jgi:4-aminobutyrate aminotransferase-like enzyme